MVEGGREPAAVVLAAGLSRRMGRPKLVLALRGRPVLWWTVHAVRRLTGAVPWVVVPPAGPVAELAGSEGWPTIVNPDPEAGVGTSLARAVARLAPRPLLVFLGDEPHVSAQATQAVLDAARRCPQAAAVEPSFEGVPGHPVLLRGPALDLVRTLTGDRGARAVLGQLPTGLRVVVAVAEAPPPDLDTPADWAALETRWGEWEAKERSDG
jgi:molybdenum cofactor cytidylyltransferase